MRLDIYLHTSGKCPSRQRGRYLIEGGQVTVDGKVCTKPSFDIDGRVVEIIGDDIPYVSRGGLKLEGALLSFSVDVKGKSAVDIGSSTGGFTDCLLQKGASEVFAVDSGSNQLHESLRGDSRVIVMENFNARALTFEHIGKKVDIAVMDVSFISQSLLYGGVSSVLKDDGVFISLIKPQFEAGRSALNKKGIVSDKGCHQKVIKELSELAKSHGLFMTALAGSPIKGGDGNCEYLALFVKGGEIKVDDGRIKAVVYG